MSSVLNPRDLAFLLYELLDTDALATRPRFAGQDREVWDAALTTARSVAETYFRPSRGRNDAEEPQFINGRVVTHDAVAPAYQAAAEAGIIAATHDADRGGVQLPHTIASAMIAWLEAANVGSSSYAMLTAGAANLLAAFGSAEQQATWLPPMLEGRFSGTMALTEPDAGSALADLRTQAIPQADGTYHLVGTKIWISGGDHDLTDNIVHLVLARIAGAPRGTKGISLFLVPRQQLAADGSVGAWNHVTVGGIIHKMGWRGTVSTVLNFGESGPCVGWLVGEPHRGLTYMFHMMNEARIAVGRSAAAMGSSAYRAALEYAQTRTQGRLPSEKDPTTPPVPLVAHADIRRLLLQAKCATEGSMALVLTCARLVDDEQTAATEAERVRATRLLDLLTPIAKSWPSISCQEAISQAMQVMGGYGYAREYDVEQLYRDNRLNQIHEGTNGIQAIDLLGRKVPQHGGAALQAFAAWVQADCAAAGAAGLSDLAEGVEGALAALGDVTGSLLAALQADATRGLANASVYLEVASRVVYGWIWLRQATVAQRALPEASTHDAAFYRGKIAAARFYVACELPKNGPELALLRRNDAIALTMSPDWF